MFDSNKYNDIIEVLIVYKKEDDMSDMRKYLNIINEAVKPAVRPKKKKVTETNAKRGDTVLTSNGYARVAKVFDDGYMVKLNADNSTSEIDFKDATKVDVKKDVKKGTLVKHANGMAKIVKVFDDGYMIKFESDSNAQEVDFDEVVLIK